MMQTDVKSAAVAAGQTDASVFAGPARIKGLLISYPSGGTVTLKDNATTVFSFTAPAAIGTVNVLIPGEGILCRTNVKATTAASTTVTVFYG